MEDINHGIMEYLKVFFRRKWLLIVPAFLCLMVGICVAMVLPKEYISSMKLLIEEEKNDNPLLSNIAVSTAAAQRIQTIRETMLGWDSLVELSKRLKLDKGVRTHLELELLVKKLQNKIDFRPLSPNIIQISYVSSNPRLAQAVVKTITDIYVERNVLAQNRETNNAIKFIEEQLHVYRGKIKSAQIAELKDKLSALLIDSTDLHPQVRELRSQIDKKMQELKSENLEYTEDAKLSLERTTNTMVTQIQQALVNLGQKSLTAPSNKTAEQNEPEKDFYKMMVIDKIDNVMARDVNVNETIYNTLLQRLETAKITQRLQSSSEGTRYTIIEDARVPSKPFKPNKILVAFIGLFLGLVIGVGLIILAELLDNSFLDVDSASQFLGVPLLGSISKITTLEIVEQYKQRQILLVFRLIASGALMLIMTIMLKGYR